MNKIAELIEAKSKMLMLGEESELNDLVLFVKDRLKDLDPKIEGVKIEYQYEAYEGSFWYPVNEWIMVDGVWKLTRNQRQTATSNLCHEMRKHISNPLDYIINEIRVHRMANGKSFILEVLRDIE